MYIDFLNRSNWSLHFSNSTVGNLRIATWRQNRAVVGGASRIINSGDEYDYGSICELQCPSRQILVDKDQLVRKESYRHRATGRLCIVEKYKSFHEIWTCWRCFWKRAVINCCLWAEGVTSWHLLRRRSASCLSSKPFGSNLKARGKLDSYWMMSNGTLVMNIGFLLRCCGIMRGNQQETSSLCIQHAFLLTFAWRTRNSIPCKDSWRSLTVSLSVGNRVREFLLIWQNCSPKYHYSLEYRARKEIAECRRMLVAEWMTI